MMIIRPIDLQVTMVGADYICGIEAVAADGKVVMAMAATAIAEVHMATAEWATPSERWLLLQEMHRRMNAELRARGVRQGVTWFERAESFCKRLLSLGWLRSEQTSFHWVVR